MKKYQRYSNENSRDIQLKEHSQKSQMVWSGFLKGKGLLQ